MISSNISDDMNFVWTIGVCVQLPVIPSLDQTILKKLAFYQSLCLADDIMGVADLFHFWKLSCSLDIWKWNKC